MNLETFDNFNHLLILSCHQNDKEAVEMLMNYPIDVNACWPNKITALYMALNNQNKEIVRLLLRKGADVNQIFHENGSNAIFKPADNGNICLAKLLLEYGADINSEAKDRMSPLLVSLLRHQWNMTQFLIEHGANVNHINKHGVSVLWIAFSFQQFNIMAMMIEYGADVNFLLDHNYSLLLAAISTQNSNLAELLMKKNANIHQKTSHDGMSTLCWAVHNQMANIVHMLIDYGVDVNYVRPNGISALMTCALNGNATIAKLLIDAGADLNFFIFDGMFPLIVAIEKNNTAVAKLLINVHANLNIQQDKIGSSALTSAIHTKNMEIFHLLITKGALFSQEHWMNVSKIGSVEMMEILIHAGMNVNSMDEMENTALTTAIFEGHVSIVKTLVDAGVYLEQLTQGKTPLMFSVYEQKLDVTRLLIESGANVNACEEHSNATPLFLAVMTGFNPMVQLLIENGANLNQIYFEDQRTILMEAAATGDFKMVVCLMEAGADINQKNIHGKTAFDFAANNMIKQILTPF